MDTSIDVVWKALPQVFARLGYAGGASTSGKYTFLTPHLTVKGQLYAGTPTSTYIDCGRAAVGAQAADVYSVTFAILTRLSAKSLNETSVDVLIDGRALQQGARSYFVPCTGTGKLEREVIQAVVAQTVPHSRTARRPR